MDFFSHPVIAVVILLGVLVFVHELGHYLVGRASGIAVEVFSIGFGPVLVSFNRKETNYRICAIPLGGYVKFFGALRSEEVPAHVRGREFYNASLLGRMATVSAGPIANFLLAIVVFSAQGWFGIESPASVAGKILPDSPAAKAGLQPLDRIVAINGEPTEKWTDLSRKIEEHPNEQLQLTVQRQDQELTLSLVTEAQEDEMGRPRGKIGISPSVIQPVLTIDQANSAAAQAGLKTGLLVQKITFGGQDHEVKYWPEFVNLLSRALQQGSSEVTLTTIPFRPGESSEKASDSVSASTYTLPLPISIDVDQSAEDLVSQLGIRNSELTIFKAEGIAALEAGDRLVSWNGESLQNLFDFERVARDYQQTSATIGIIRAGQLLELEVPLKPVDVQRPEGKVTIYRLPIEIWGAFDYAGIHREEYSNPLRALWYGVEEFAYVTKTIAVGVFSLFTGDMPLKALGGPISIAKIASDTAKLGIPAFTMALAWLSINLGLINLVPIPALDGGQLVLLCAEGVNRRPLPEVVIENYQKIGFVMIMALVVLATYNDLGRFWTSMIQGMKSIF